MFYFSEPECIYILKSLESYTALTAASIQTSDVEVPITTIIALLSCQRCPLHYVKCLRENAMHISYYYSKTSNVLPQMPFGVFANFRADLC